MKLFFRRIKCSLVTSNPKREREIFNEKTGASGQAAVPNRKRNPPNTDAENYMFSKIYFLPGLHCRAQHRVNVHTLLYRKTIRLWFFLHTSSNWLRCPRNCLFRLNTLHCFGLYLDSWVWIPRLFRYARSSQELLVFNARCLYFFSYD